MANINKIKLSGTTYNIQDLSAAKSVELTQAQYDALVTGGTVDPNTFYIITDAQGADLSQYYTSAQTESAITAAVSNTVTTNTNQDITGTKTFFGEKKIKFKQSTDSNKLGFTLYNSASTNNELASFELRPDTFTIDNVSHPLLYIGHYRKTEIANAGVPQTVVGFRQYDQANSAAYHLLAPLPSDAKTPFNLTTTFKNFYMPIGIKVSNSTTVTASSGGVVDISSYIGGGGGGGTSYTAGTGIDITNDVISVTGMVDTATFNTYSGSVDTALSGKQDTLSAGTGIEISGNVISATGGGGGASYSAGTGIDITNDVISVSGVVMSSAVTSAVTSGSTDVVTSGGVYDQLGGMKIVKLTESEYTALVTKDDDTLYCVVPDPSN